MTTTSTRQLASDEQLAGGSLASLQDTQQYTEHATPEVEDSTHVPTEDNKEQHHDSLHLPQPSQPSPDFDPALHYTLSLNLQYPYLSHAQPHLGIHDMSQYSQQEQLLIPPLHNQEFQAGQSLQTGQVVVTTPTTPAKAQRKSRWRPTPAQKELLEAYWAENQYPDRMTKQKLATDLGITSDQVSRWFKHRRENFAHKGTNSTGKRNQAKSSPTVPILGNQPPVDNTPKADLGAGKLTYRNEAATKFSNEQHTSLESAFKDNPYPQKEDIANVAAQLGVSQQRVKNWFKAHRSRMASKGTFEFKQRLQTTPDRKRKEMDGSPLLEEAAKRQELIGSAGEELVDIVDEDQHHQITALANAAPHDESVHLTNDGMDTSSLQHHLLQETVDHSKVEPTQP